ncbi:MAG: glycosyltransferase family 4 protein [Candidatus Terrybacteria bacterium]|nr:glycosyltransferase family 4 protein [Candidatus Terrybacteria bacterium]
MRILSLGLDRSALDKNSNLSKRISEYKKIVEQYDVVVPDSKNKIIGLIRIFFQSKKILKKEKYDVITVQDAYYLAFLGWFLARRFGIGLNLQIHGFEKYRGIRKLLAKFVIPRADSIRVVSQRLKRQLVEEFGVGEGKITVVPIYVEISTKSEIRNPKQINKFVFLTVGRLVVVKNIKMQIEAMGEIINKQLTTNNLQLELWIVGEGPERKNYELLITNYKLQDNIKLFGWQEDVSKFYQEADAFLLTSDYEGWGMAVIEAASYGLPIIMTDVGCAGEIIKNNESGIVIPVSDSKKLAEAMLKVMEDDDLRKNLGARARSTIEKLPNKEETLRLYKESWEKAL